MTAATPVARRHRRRPLFIQVFVVMVLSVLAAQLANFALVLLSPPPAPQLHTSDDVVFALMTGRDTTGQLTITLRDDPGFDDRGPRASALKTRMARRDARSLGQRLMEWPPLVSIYESRLWRRSGLFARLTGIPFEREMACIVAETRPDSAVGVLGRDAAGDDVEHLLREAGLDVAGLVRVDGRPTPVKTRVMAGGHESTRHQVVRLDREPDAQLRMEVEDDVIARVKAAGRDADAFIVSDYGYGTLTPRLYERIRSIARRRNIITTADSRYDLPSFSGVTAATPNEAELAELTATAVDDERSLEKAGRQLLERLDARMLLVTRGSQGLALLERDGATTFIPIFGSDEIADVTGAGDTVISAFTVALAAGGSPVEAATLANMAGGLVVMKRGTATVARAELVQALAAGAP